MKKLISVFFVCLVTALVGLSSPPAAAQVYGGYCCDGDGLIRCRLIQPVPVGNTCFCPGQGYGWTCR